MNPTKIILKTTAKTLGVLVVLVLIFAFALGVFFPRKLSNITYSIGMTSLSIKLDEASYGKTKSIDDLTRIIDKSIEVQNYANTVKYINLARERDDFDAFCNGESLRTNSDYGMYIIGNYISALIRVGDSDLATDVCCQYTSCSGTAYIDYIKYIYVVVDDYAPTAEKSNKIKALFNGIEDNVSAVGDRAYSNYLAEKQAIFNKLGF